MTHPYRAGGPAAKVTSEEGGTAGPVKLGPQPSLIDAALGRWVGIDVVAEALGMSRRSVERAVMRKEIPPPVRFGRLLRWKLATVEKFLKEREAKAS